ncbi:sensor histidine kinase [Hymenobacter sp. PAMC 26628]|uniref:sensor histidine kinase n=1 Tax=Hymenobacter sp. PAMC 26628 TaxID=1484118 RepID=UPI0007706183|nr:ATP-binding protein [Hymenobacter sp. PAMC 26628]AMJ65181.1 hypothetical protein AXW84_06890 [Hymenobacter sp. PAMC 26628]
MTLKLKIRLGVGLLLLLLLGLGGYALATIAFLEKGARGIEQADFDAARRAVTAFVMAGTVLGVLLLVRLPRAVVGPLHRLRADMEQVAGPGPATRVAVRKNDEIGNVAAAVNLVLGQAQDERRITLAELLVQRNRMDSLVMSLDEGLLLLDQHGDLVLANPAACNLLGETAATLLGRPAAEVARTNSLLADLLAAVAVPHPSDAVVQGPVFTIPHKTPEPHYRLTIGHIEAPGADGGPPTPAGHVLCLRNVSDFKKLDQLKSNFLATISHELKTPLASINLSLFLLQDERTDPEERQRIAAGIRDETQRLLGMVGQLIDVSRLDAGAGIQLNVRALALADVVAYATGIVRPQLEDKQLQLELRLPPDLPAVHGDVEKTSWVLINLLANAIRYSPAGAPLVIQAVPWGEMVQLSVRDQGPGIAREHHKRIFQRFAGVPGAPGQGPSPGSSGLGLSISREFIAAQGGQLWVESQPPAGSCFLFTLPVAG